MNAARKPWKNDDEAAAGIVAELTGRGVTLWEDEGRLRFRGPAGALTDQHRAELTAHRDAVLAFLRAETAAPVITPDPAGRHEPFPLTDVQSAYLLGRGTSFHHGGVACQVYLELVWPDVHPDRLTAAWNRLIARHDMLRAVVDVDGSQRVRPTVAEVQVPVLDLRSAAPERVADALDAVRRELDHRNVPAGHWPMVDLRATRLAEQALLHVAVDFLVADWASISLLLGELRTLHDTPEAALPEPGVTFRDYVLAERGLRDSARYRRDREYWLDRIDELPAAPDLPVRDSAGQSPPRFRRHTVQLGIDDWTALQDRARAHGATPSMAVLGAYTAVLGRWSRSERFTINMTVLNRLPLHPDVDRLVGDFTSVSLLAVPDAADRSLGERIAALGAQLHDDLDHRLFSGVEVLRELNRRRGRDAALMPVVFTGSIGVGGDAGRALADGLGPHGVTQTPQVFIDCQAGDGAAGLQVNWDVREGIFPDGMVEDMFAAFSALLSALAADEAVWTGPATAAVPLPAWQVAERSTANDTAAALPAGLLHEPVFARAAAEPDRTAVIDRHGAVGYGVLAARAAAVAAALRAAGAERGEHVAIVMDKGAEQVAAVLGTLLAGAVYVPVDTVQPALRRAAMLADARVRHVLTQSWVAPGLESPAGTSVLAVDTLPDGEPPATVPAGDPDAPAYVIFTSGSTGRPKGVVMTHRAASNTVLDINRRYAVTADDRVLGLANLGFDLSVYDLFGPLSVGGALVLPDPRRRTDPSHWAALAAEHSVTVWDSVPALMQMLTTYLDDEPVDLPALRLVMLSGDWIPVTLPTRIRERLPAARTISLGGATEAAIWSIQHRIDEVDPDWPSIPYGTPLANQTFRVLDPARRDSPVWVPGELHIGGAGLAAGYLGDPELSATRFVGGPSGQRLYRTGDLGRYRPGGEIEFLGREDGQVKVRGHRIEMGEVEATLLAHPDVAAAAVVLERPATEPRLLAAVEPARTPGAAPPDLGRVLRIAAAAADRADTGFAADRVGEAVAELDAAVLVAMTAALGKLGLFASPAQRHPVEQVLAVAQPRHGWLLGRWIAVLEAAGHLSAASDGTLSCPAMPDDAAVAQRWGRVRGLWTGEQGTEGFVDYVQASTARLPELLTGEQDPVELLFPQGDLDGAARLYRDHPMARYLNRAVAAVVHRAAAAHDPAAGPLRVLEVGAGTGATTVGVLDALAGFDVEYLFTDVSPFFLPAARARYAELGWVSVGTFDVDVDARAQGLAPNSFDVVLAAGVLENARDVPAALDRLVELAAPGGWLVVTEPTREHPWILASQAFMMTPPEDDRAGSDSYLDDSRWQAAIAAATGGPVLRLPARDDPRSGHGLHLFAGPVKTDRAALRPEAVTGFLAERLPAHMLPAYLQVVDALPLTGNGKIDRATVAGWRPAGTGVGPAPAGAEPIDDLERSIAAVWATALGLPRVGRTDSFFALGADSLIMAQVAGRLRDEVTAAAPAPFDALLQRMLAEPDVASVAAFLRAPAAPEVPAGRRAEHSNALLVPFSEQWSGTAPAQARAPMRVMFHAGLGTMECYRPLAARLVAQGLGPVHGIAVADPEVFVGLDPRVTVEHAADDYCRRLVETGATRFQLIGYCLGGMYATEVARRLVERGLEVVDLVLVSSHPVVVDVEEELMIETLFVPNLHIGLADAGFGPVDAEAAVRAFGAITDAHGGRVPAGTLTAIGGDPERDALGAFFRSLESRSQAERLVTYAQAAGTALGREMPAELVTGMHRMFRHAFLAARFTPPPYAGDIRFLRPTGPFAFAPGMDASTLAFWREVCLGSFSVSDVGGDHFSCMEPPVVDDVAALVAAPLAVAR